MIASMPVRVRRFAATAALTAVAGAGALAAAPVALADPAADPAAVSAADTAVVTPTVTAPTPPPATSPLPAEPVTVKVKGFTFVLQPVVVQAVQTVIADYLADQGRLYTYDSKGRLVVGPKICDPKKDAKANKGCVAADAGRVG
jgi:hypothetical protein